uniref:Uncharacterized protein n=1 Tax=Fagus sylvatica TaxID=28930 RepID=A0A2N9H583_FAGSY
MSGNDEMQVLDVQELDDVGVTSNSGTGLQESNTGGEGPPYEPKGPGLALQTLQNPVTPATLYMRAVTTAKNKEKEARGKGNQFRPLSGLVVASSYLVESEEPHGTIMSGKMKCKFWMQELDDVGVTSNSGTGLQGDHLHYLLLKVQTLQNPVTPVTLYMRAVTTAKNKEKETRGKGNQLIRPLSGLVAASSYLVESEEPHGTIMSGKDEMQVLDVQELDDVRVTSNSGTGLKKRPTTVSKPVDASSYHVEIEEPRGTIMSGRHEMQVFDVQELDQVGVTSNSGTGLQESNTGGGGPPYEPKGARARPSATAKNMEKEAMGKGKQFRSSKLMHTGDRSTRDEEVLAHPNHDQYLNKKIKLFDQMATVVRGMVTGGSLGDVEMPNINPFDNQDFDLEGDEPDSVSNEKFMESSNDNIKESSNENSSKRRSNRKIRRGVNENNPCNQISEQLKEIVVSLKALKQGPDAAELYEVVMKTEGFDEEMLAIAFDYLVQEEKVGRSFMAQNANLRKIWLENFFTKDDGQ